MAEGTHHAQLFEAIAALREEISYLRGEQNTQNQMLEAVLQQLKNLATSYDQLVAKSGNCSTTEVSSMEELGYDDSAEVERTPFKGGESEALRRLRESLPNKEWVANFEKPKDDPSAFLSPATTVLSPYLKFGCLSSRYFYQCSQDIQRTVMEHTSRPVSLLGQLLWRDFFYTVAFGTPNFEQMKDNRICKQILWKNDYELLIAWRDGRTGFPWIDAIMVQLHKWEWMHHLARHIPKEAIP